MGMSYVYIHVQAYAADAFNVADCLFELRSGDATTLSTNCISELLRIVDQQSATINMASKIESCFGEVSPPSYRDGSKAVTNATQDLALNSAHHLHLDVQAGRSSPGTHTSNAT
ncbi:hypothetical protein INS49_001727 [Diaporthe citri]|uniref:uncharacterized protein n=1 Tax=Diaporthe citri TaxID=83186 RepID=UPI001C81E57D|nr:uncharacterized protein INS49_001727 [Diaporthe citri]KAG6367535.1 hypothetical protein INS49_001727 [Diaporthe citri]